MCSVLGQLAAAVLIFVYLAEATVAFRCGTDDSLLNADGRLRKKLLCDYDPSVKPVRNVSQAVEVYVQMLVKSFNFVRMMLCWETLRQSAQKLVNN